MVSALVLDSDGSRRGDVLSALAVMEVDTECAADGDHAAALLAAREFDALTWLGQHFAGGVDAVAVFEQRHLGLLRRAVLVTREGQGERLDRVLAALADAMLRRDLDLSGQFVLVEDVFAICKIMVAIEAVKRIHVQFMGKGHIRTLFSGIGVYIAQK